MEIGEFCISIRSTSERTSPDQRHLWDRQICRWLCRLSQQARSVQLEPAAANNRISTDSIYLLIYRVHSKLKGQNSRTFQGPKICSFQVPKVSIKRHIILALNQNLESNIYFSVLTNTALMIKADYWHQIICNPFIITIIHMVHTK